MTWFEPFTTLYEWELPHAKWYLGGTLNVCFNCVDRHVLAGNGARVAFCWEGEPEDERREITYALLQRDVARMANALRLLGVRKGTPVAIYMGMVPELPVAMLACARLGAAHRRVRRLLGGLAVGPHERHGLRGARDPGRGLATRLARPTQGDRRRCPGGGAGSAALSRGSTHGRRGVDDGRARRLLRRPLPTAL